MTKSKIWHDSRVASTFQTELEQKFDSMVKFGPPKASMNRKFLRKLGIRGVRALARPRGEPSGVKLTA